MKLFEGLWVFLLVCATFAQDISEPEEKFQEEGRGLRNYDQDWRAVDYLSPLHETSGWIQHPQSETEEQPLKRRRIRKRKRRPPVYAAPDEETEEPVASRRKRPQRLDQIKEPWEEMTEESAQKSNTRRRLLPIYSETEVTGSRVQVSEKIRDPFTALQEAEEKQKTKVEESTTKTLDLKTLLKQSGGLSLSEVLQQKNLTLAELLKGNRQAISVLAKEAETATEIVTTTESVKYRRLPPSIGMKKGVGRNFVKHGELNERLTEEEVQEAQRKRLSILHSHKDTKMFPDVIKFDVVTEQTTEKRVFVPSIELKISTEYVDLITTTTQATPVSSKPERKLPMTSAKLNKLTTQSSHEDVSEIPNKAVSININEIFGFNIFKKPNESESSDEPFKMIIDLEEMSTEIPRYTSKNLDEVTTMMSPSEKLKHVTAKEEIMEILNNPLEREELSRILRTRNMTLEELVAQRERGSSQLHLADIFHNKTREPEPKDEPFIGHIQPDDDEIPVFNRKGKTIPIVSQMPSSTQSFLKAQETTTKLPYTITSFPTYKIETNKDVRTQPFLPVWQQLYPHFFEDVYENENNEESPGIVRPTTAFTEKMNFEEIDSLEEIENSLDEAAHGRLKVDLPQNVYDDEEFISLPSGVKSAILASLAIIGLSLLVFLTILLIFKWTQKQKRRLNYNGSFLASKIRSPILEPNQKRTFKTFVSETLGKKKNYYQAHIQSMSDSFWDKDEKKSYMI